MFSATGISQIKMMYSVNHDIIYLPVDYWISGESMKALILQGLLEWFYV